MNRRFVFRVIAPVAFLAAVTIAVLLVRSGLRHHAATTTTTTTATAPILPTITTTPQPSRRRFYRIRSGDTLGSIAIRFHTTVGQLRRLNPKVDPHALSPGERIRVR